MQCPSVAHREGKGLDTWYSAAYTRRLEQQLFTILEVAADWYELMVMRRVMQPSTARDSKQVGPRRSTTDIPSPQSAALDLHPVARRLLLIPNCGDLWHFLTSGINNIGFVKVRMHRENHEMQRKRIASVSGNCSESEGTLFHYYFECFNLRVLIGLGGLVLFSWWVDIADLPSE